MIEFETRRRSTPRINLSALIDIAFILVIFIVLGATFQRVRVIDVDLPSADARSNPDDEALVITVPRTGPLRFGDREVAGTEIHAALLEARTRHSAVLLVADRESAIQRALQILGEAQQIGFESLTIAAKPEAHPQGGDVP